jgi:hypothetical protein
MASYRIQKQVPVEGSAKLADIRWGLCLPIWRRAITHRPLKDAPRVRTFMEGIGDGLRKRLAAFEQ